MLAESVWNYAYTYLKVKLKSKYPKLTCTNSSMNETDPSFPNLFINQIDAPHTGTTMEKGTEEAIVSNIQLEASSNIDLTEARSIINDAGDILIAKGYTVVSGPLQSNTSVYRMILRLRRTYGINETF